MIPPNVERYFLSRPLPGSWRISGNEGENFDGAVVIPALAERDSLFATLRSLARNPRDLLSRFLILVVINHRSDAPPRDRRNNAETLARLPSEAKFLEDLQLAWVDAASPGLEMSPKIGGVGLARKIGFDLALTRLNYQKGTPLLISLDADTLARPDYLPALTQHFRNVEAIGSQSSVGTTVVPTLIDRSPGGGAVIPFCHQPGSNSEEDRAIHRYELFLRTYVLGLSRAGSPYAFHTVGSAMACTAGAYVRMGGMNHRGAGEDFYFLQHLAKTAGISRVKGTVVYPSARTSYRVPFGTGRSITDLLAQKEGAVMFYRVECYQILAGWLNLVGQTLNGDGKFILEQAEKISGHLGDFLKGIEFEAYWERLKRNFHTPRTLLRGFHGWFDGLTTMKFIHFLSAGPYPRVDPEKAVPRLLEWAGLEQEKRTESQLQLLRKFQIGTDY